MIPTFRDFIGVCILAIGGSLAALGLLAFMVAACLPGYRPIVDAPEDER